MTWKDEVAAALQHTGMTHAEAANLLGVRAGTVSDWVRGEAVPHRNAMKRYRETLADALAGPRNKRSEAPAPLLSVAPPQTGAAVQRKPPTFQTDAERTAWTLGVLHLAQELSPS